MPNPWLHRVAILHSVCTFALMTIGGVVTSMDAGMAIPDWPLAYGKLVPAQMTGEVQLAFLHRITAAAVSLLMLLLAIWISAADTRAWLKRFAWIAVVVVLLQVGL